LELQLRTKLELLLEPQKKLLAQLELSLEPPTKLLEPHWKPKLLLVERSLLQKLPRILHPEAYTRLQQ
jgi:hypothetical protein